MTGPYSFKYTDSPAIDELARRVRGELEVLLGNDDQRIAAVLGAALLDTAGNLGVNWAIQSVRMASRTRLGHAMGSQLLRDFPERAEALADSAAERKRRTTSLPTMSMYAAEEAVLLGWVEPAPLDDGEATA